MKNHARFTVRCTLAERAELEVKSRGLGLSEYARTVLFEGESDAMFELRARLEELRENQAVLQEMVRELVNVKAAPPPQQQPIAAQAHDNSRLDRIEGIVLEQLLLLRGSRSRTDLNAAQNEVERQKLPIHGDEPYKPMIETGVKPIERQPQADVERQETPARRGVMGFFGGK